MVEGLAWLRPLLFLLSFQCLMSSAQRDYRGGRLEKSVLRLPLKHVQKLIALSYRSRQSNTRAMKVRGYESDNFSDPFLRALG